MQATLEYIYTGVISISEDNAREITEISARLQVCYFLLNNSTLINMICVLMYYLLI